MHPTFCCRDEAVGWMFTPWKKAELGEVLAVSKLFGYAPSQLAVAAMKKARLLPVPTAACFATDSEID